MAHRIAPRAFETFTVTGTGNITTTGAVGGGYRTLAAAPGMSVNADTMDVVLWKETFSEWEAVRLTRASASTFTRGTPYDSSNAGAAVNFTAGTGLVWGDTPIPKEGSWTPVLAGFTQTGALTVAGKYTKVENIVFFQFQARCATSLVSVAGTSTITGLPFAPVSGPHGSFTAELDTALSGGVGLILQTGAGTLYPPSLSAGAAIDIVGSGFYFTS